MKVPRTKEELSLIKTYQLLLDTAEKENLKLRQQLNSHKLINLISKLRKENYKLKKELSNE